MPLICAPVASASYSRAREIAICTIIAAIGARIIARIPPNMPPRPSRLPANSIMLPIIAIAPAMVAVMVMVSVSRWWIWASSWAITPSISSADRWFSRPCVTATAEFSGLRPVAKALGCWVGSRYSLGIGICARSASRAVIAYSSAPCWGDNSIAPC